MPLTMERWAIAVAAEDQAQQRLPALLESGRDVRNTFSDCDLLSYHHQEPARS